MTIEDLHGTLNQLGFEVRQSKEADNQLRVVCRVPLDPVNTSRWLQLMERLLLRAEHAAWDVDCSKQYFMRGGTLTFGWRLILQGQGIAQHLSDIISVLTMIPTTTRELDEVHLHAGPNRNALSPTGKGAQGVLTAVVGPVAHRQLQQQGR
jgi:hypothetical protein